MANFEIGNWVLVTPQEDLRWSEWSEAHSYFRNRIGRITEIWADYGHPDNRDEDYCKVEVFFADYTFPTGPGWFFLTFKKRHLILQTASDAQQYIFDEEAVAETNSFERSVKRKRDEIFRYICTEQREYERIERFEDDMNDENLFDKWILLEHS